MEDNTLKELAAAMDPEPVADGEYTIQDLEQVITGLGTEAIRYRMAKLVLDKLLTRRKAKRSDGQPCIAYKPVEGKTWDDVIDYIKGGIYG